MKINIKNKNQFETNTPLLSLDEIASQWAELVIAHIEANKNLKSYNDYKFPIEVSKNAE